MYTIEQLTELIDNCTLCELHKGKTHYVVGDGNIKSKIMFIGEGPGEQEDVSGVPFVGKAGQLLDKMLASIDLDREKVYICNVVKCRPPKNRNPQPEEIAACINYLRWQFTIMKPKIIVLLGSVACQALLDPKFSITKRHGEIIQVKKTLFIPTYHPAALLRDPAKKKEAWEDLKNVRAKINELGLR
ncbi:MAG: uracil-DNA glycosylase [Clostridia bacterium]|nr:uracil-DNA glycosylase [Clostridia bacterium]